MIGVFALPALAVISAAGLRDALKQRWMVALLVAAAMSLIVALIEFALPLPLTISERIALWCLPALAATDAASRCVSRSALAVAAGFALWGHAVQQNYNTAILSFVVSLALLVPLFFAVRRFYGEGALGVGDFAFSIWLALALGIVSPLSLGLGALLGGRRRETPLVAYAALGAVAIVSFLAVWGRFPWRS